jgi:hypothetical protein
LVKSEVRIHLEWGVVWVSGVLVDWGRHGCVIGGEAHLLLRVPGRGMKRSKMGGQVISEGEKDVLVVSLPTHPLDPLDVQPPEDEPLAGFPFALRKQ